MPQRNLEIKEVQFANAILLPEVVKLLDEGHTVTLRLKGFSMRPFLENERDKALLKAVDEIHVGDPVLAEISQGVYVLHRIIAIHDEQVILRGDGNLTTETCRRQDVKGIATGFYRKGKKQLDRTDGWKWKTYSWLWMRLFPIRRYLLAFYRRIWIKIFKQ